MHAVPLLVGVLHLAIRCLSEGLGLIQIQLVEWFIDDHYLAVDFIFTSGDARHIGGWILDGIALLELFNFNITEVEVVGRAGNDDTQ